MGVVAVDAEQILLISVPVAGPFTVDADLPVAEFVAVTLTAQTVGLGKIDQFPGNKAQLVTVQQVVAIRAPALPFGVVQHDFLMVVGQNPPFRIRLHVGVTLGTRENSLRKRGAWHRINIFRLLVFYVVCGHQISTRFFHNNKLP